MEKLNNPSAFPNDTFIEEMGKRIEQQGMTLRDYFANSDVREVITILRPDVVEELLGRELSFNSESDLEKYFELDSKLRYMRADAMLKQREL